VEVPADPSRIDGWALADAAATGSRVVELYGASCDRAQSSSNLQVTRCER
jgi:hypothetical protein